jgi:hypothetical protein
MTHAEVSEYANRLIMKAVQRYGLADYSDGTTSFKTRVNEIGEVEFVCAHSSDRGRFEWRFAPQLYIEWQVREMAENIEYCRSKGMPVDAMKQHWETDIFNIVSIMIRLLTDEFIDTIKFPVMAEEVSRLVCDSDVAKRSDKEFLRLAGEIVWKRYESQTKTIYRLHEEQKQRYSAPRFLFCDVYDQQLRVWQEVKKCYKKVAECDRPVPMLEANFPELDPDLLRRACDVDNYTSMPSSIALEAAARFVQAPVMGKLKSSLDRYLRQSREDRKEVTDQEAKAAYEKFVTDKREIENYNQNIRSLIQAHFRGQSPKHEDAEDSVSNS